MKNHKFQTFHKSVKLRKFSFTPKHNYPEQWVKVDYKGYPRFERIKLPEPSNPEFDLFKALLLRKSQREYDDSDVTQRISDFLYYSVGKKDKEKRMHGSAGANYPCEVYLLIDNELFHYHILSHSLEKLWVVDREYVNEGIGMKWASDAPIIVFVSAIFPRTVNKYKNRGYLYVNQEVGAIWQTMQLVGTALGLGTCSIGGFKDDHLNKMLDLDGTMETVMSVMTVGKLKGGDERE